VAVLEDACWHRLLPLSMGRLDGDEVTCGYHGLVYNAEGRCTHMPSARRRSTRRPACAAFRWWSAPLCLGLARRPGQGRPGAGARPALERRPGLGRRRQADHGEVRLPPGGRQPDGPDARDLRARRQHRPAGGGRGAVRRHPRRPHRHRDPLDGGTSTRRRSGPGRSAGRGYRAGGPLADHPLRGAVHRGHRRGRGRGRHRRCARHRRAPRATADRRA
jgi:hypothetical protein